MSDPLVNIDPEVMSGTPCFAGTRVPIQTLADFLTEGESIEEFLEGFPGVSRGQAVAFIQQSTERMLATVIAECEPAR